MGLHRRTAVNHPAIVAPARSAPIGDRFLHQIRNLAHAARRGDVTAIEAELVLHTVGPLLDELIARRAAAAGRPAIDGGGNVVAMPGIGA
jgi:hypothetical protein